LPEVLAESRSGRSGFVISGIEVTLFITSMSEHTLRISLLPVDSHLEPAQAFTANGLRDQLRPPPPGHILRQAPEEALTCGKFSVRVTDSPITITVTQEGTESQRLMLDDTTGRVSFDLFGQPVFGFGEGGHQFDRRGVADVMRNGQFKPDQFVNGGRSPIPWLIGPGGWGLFFHHPAGTFDLTGAQGVFRPGVAPEAQDIFLILNRDPAVLLREFAELSGFPHLPPRWAFGYQQSHRTLSSREAVLEEVRTFREKKLPCDVMIFLGTGFAPSGWNTGHASFAFNPRIFPDPKAMFDEMHRDNMHVILHVLGVPFDLHGRVSDHSYDPDSAANYWADHVEVFRTGIDGWWVDDGDELLPQGRLDRDRMYWEGPLQERPNVRPFSLQRNGYAGLQQFGFLWSGDINSAWETLRVQIANGLNTGLSGIPYWGTDTGGFFSTKELTAELYVRWFQFSSFCPLFRAHGRTWMLRLPWGWNRGNVGPVEDDPGALPLPDELHHPEVEDICRKYLNLRYQLLPYLYSAAREAHDAGMPMMRALWLAFPGDTAALAVDDAYLWGASLLVAPVAAASVKDRRVYLPQGTWFDYWTGEQITGGREHVRAVDLATMPLYVRAGSILPMGPVKQSTGERTSAPTELHIYPGGDGRATLYEDDGVSMDHTRGVCSTIEVGWSDQERRLLIALAHGSVMHAFTSRTFQVQVAGSPRVKTVEFRGTAVTVDL
jgi:alpha-glucosidase/alpha-D-xyloside xylohydrolase